MYKLHMYNSSAGEFVHRLRLVGCWTPHFKRDQSLRLFLSSREQEMVREQLLPKKPSKTPLNTSTTPFLFKQVRLLLIQPPASTRSSEPKAKSQKPKRLQTDLPLAVKAENITTNFFKLDFP